MTAIAKILRMLVGSARSIHLNAILYPRYVKYPRQRHLHNEGKMAPRELDGRKEEKDH